MGATLGVEILAAESCTSLKVRVSLLFRAALGPSNPWLERLAAVVGNWAS